MSQTCKYQPESHAFSHHPHIPIHKHTDITRTHAHTKDNRGAQRNSLSARASVEPLCVARATTNVVFGGGKRLFTVSLVNDHLFFCERLDTLNTHTHTRNVIALRLLYI